MQIRLFASTITLFCAAHAVSAQSMADAAQCDRAIGGNAADRAVFQRAAVANVGTAMGQFAAGCMQAIANAPDSAAKFFEAATKSNPRSSAAFLWLGNSLGQQALAGNMMVKARLATKIRDAYLEAVRLDGSNLDARDGLMQYYAQAPSMMGGDTAKAREQAEIIARSNPFRGLSALITVASSRGDKAAVERYLTQATTQFPDSVLGWANLTAVQADAGRVADAFATIARWQARGTNSMYVLFATGRTAAVSGQQLDRGAQALQQYLRGRRAPIDPPFANANMRLGQIYERQGKKVEARTAYAEALRLNPNLADAKTALDRLK
jgi:tetratricopeptide (TPR) repeat protein